VNQFLIRIKARHGEGLNRDVSLLSGGNRVQSRHDNDPNPPLSDLRGGKGLTRLADGNDALQARLGHMLMKPFYSGQTGGRDLPESCANQAASPTSHLPHRCHLAPHENLKGVNGCPAVFDDVLKILGTPFIYFKETAEDGYGDNPRLQKDAICRDSANCPDGDIIIRHTLSAEYLPGHPDGEKLAITYAGAIGAENLLRRRWHVFFRDK